MTLAYRKNHVLKVINAFQQEAWVASVESFLNTLLQQNKAYLYASPLIQHLDVATLMTEQNYQKAKVVALFGALEEDEPFESLLNDLSV
jgi:hypothetical protein